MARHGQGTPGFDPKNYVFYYFQNYLTFGEHTPGYNFANMTQQVRLGVLQKQIANVKARTHFLIENSGEAGKSLEELLNSEQVVGQVMSAMNTLTVNVTPNQIIDKNLTMSSAARINALAEELANDMSFFLTSLNNMINEMYQMLSSPQTLEAYSEVVIAQYAQSHRTNGPIGQQILNSFLTDGLKEFNQSKGNATAQLESDIKKCILLVEALPEFSDYITSGQGNFTTNSDTSFAGQFFRTVFRKIGGLKAHAQGMMGEIATAAGLASASQKVLQDTHKIITTELVGTGTSRKGSWITADVRIKEDANQAATANNKDNIIKKTANKKDVQVNIDVVNGNGTVTSTVSFGANVKSYRVNPTKKFKTYTIHDSGSFANAYAIAFPQDSNFMFLYNLGAGHTAQRRLGGMTGSGLDAQWSQMIRTVAVSNLATALAGGITENTLFLVLSGRVFLISDVLESILSFIEVGEPGYNESNSSFGYGVQINGISREKMLATSRWIASSGKQGRAKIADQNMTLAMRRSEQALPQLQSLVDSAKITISLRTLTSVILGQR